LALDHTDNTAFERIINRPRRGLGEGAVKYIKEHANQGASLFNTACTLIKAGFPVLPGSNRKLGPKQQKALKQFIEVIENIGTIARDGKKGEGHPQYQVSPVDVIEYTVGVVRYTEHLKKKHESEQKNKKKIREGFHPSDQEMNTREANLEELKRRAKAFFDESQKAQKQEDNPRAVYDESAVTHFNVFLDWLNAQNAEEHSLEESKKAQRHDCVSLTTIHQAKGLEWPVGMQCQLMSVFSKS
jgi:superfamily I DNA/RNA helicase